MLFAKKLAAQAAFEHCIAATVVALHEAFFPLYSSIKKLYNDRASVLLRKHLGALGKCVSWEKIS
jgi:hypothetical protein